MSTLLLQQSIAPGAERCTVVDAFESMLLRGPEALATVHEAHELSYAQLHDYAARIAAQLVQRGLQPEQTVGLCLDRSHHAVAAMLGSWLAGGAFVPLDPEYPNERLRYMVEDAGVSIVVTSETYRPLFEGHDAKIVLLRPTSPDALPAAEPGELRRPRPEQLAYIMYTSGSTGMPKGVPIEHAALLNYCDADAEVYRLSAADRTLQFSTINFDIAIEEIFPPLITGGAVVVRPGERLDAQIELSALVERYGVTAIHLATGYWHEWVDLMAAAGARVPASLRLMVVTGEKVSATHYQRWRQLERRPTLWANAYGPTETTVTATVFVPPAGWDGESLPIGRALRGYSAHILDEQRRAVAAGETGELYIGGASLARGYLNRAEQTDKAFVEVDLGGDGPERLYRTGDLARWLPSGDIAYAGRIDHQLKIGSYRVEPGEVEAALNQHPEVLESLVVAEQSAHQKALLAYLACQCEQFDLAAAYAWLQQKLPPHMVPLKYILLDNFPKTINGKIDRAALPAGDTAVTATQTDYTAPVGDTEERLASIWAAQLQLARVGRDDDFFGLGGDSLLATRTLRAILGDMGISISTRDFFANPKLHQLAAVADAGGTGPTLQLERVEGPLPPTPLAASQVRLWLSYIRGHEDISIFHVYEAVRIRGELDVARLERALQQVVARHSVFQMRVRLEGDNPMMVWEDAVQIPLQRDRLPVSALQGYLSEHVIQHPFALDREPLLRLRLAELDDGSHFLLIVGHHLIVDGWAMGIVLRELAALYAGEQPPEQPWQYVDFAVADNAARARGAYDSQLQYWQRKLDGLEVAELYRDRRPPAQRRFSAGQVEGELPAALMDAVAQTAKALNCTEHALLMTAFFAVLQRQTRSRDFAVATVVHGRNALQSEGIVGNFVSSLPVRLATDPEAGFDQWAMALRESLREAIVNSDVHFDEIVRHLNPTRVDDQIPFTPYMFLFQNIPDAELSLPGLQCEHVFSDFEGIEFDLRLELVKADSEQPGDCFARLVYSDELYGEASAQRLFEQFQRLLQHAVEAPQTAIADIELLGGAESIRLLSAFNPPPTPIDAGAGFVERIWQHAQSLPERTAVSDDAGAALSYGELCARADQLARYLQGQQVGPGSLVAVSMHRSADMLVALLGILRAGAAYLPMDPGYPAERVRYILEDAAAPLLITERALRDELPDTGAAKLCLDADWPTVAAAGGELAPDDSLDTLAYVIYTSGSTGQPKGVQLSRRNVLNFLLSMRREPGLEAHDKLLAVTTLSFDISVLELFLPLLQGAEVMVASRELAMDGRRLAEVVECDGITVMQATPATWRLMLEANWRGERGIKALVGGEALPADLLPGLLARTGALWNMYGPTETTVWSTCQPITDAAAPITIGRPIDNTRVYILDERQRLCPQGTPGELCIGGEGVSRGYTNRDDLNASQFLPDPWGASEGDRLYRTGDLARWNEDGTLSYISRLDNLVKLNGYRIELGEIETRLSQHPAVSQAAVVVREDQPGAARLAGYWVAEPGQEEAAQDFQAHLADSLPAYMVPQLYMRLEAMPQTPNGKLDRKALPAPGAAARDAGDKAPLVGEAQRRVAEQWQQLLGPVPIGAEDNFFALGGFSLAATKFSNWAEREYGVPVSVRSLIMSPLAQIARQLDPDAAPSATPAAGDSPEGAEIAVELLRVGERQLCVSHIKNRRANDQALILVGSHGYEQTRTDRAYRALAEQLAGAGVHCLRLDLSGTGNSSQRSTEVASLAQWREDIRAAADSLQRQHGYRAVSLLGARLSASLLDAKLLDGLPLRHAFLWDPVLDGADWWGERLALQRAMTDSSYYFLKPRRQRDPERLHTPGFSACVALRREIEQFRLDPAALDGRFRLLLSADAPSAVEHPGIIRCEDRPAWSDLYASATTDIDCAQLRRHVVDTLLGPEA